MTIDMKLYMIFESLFSGYQIGLEISMKSSDLMFDWVDLIFHKCHEINFKWTGSYIHSPDWIKKKKVIINHIT